MRHCLTLAVVLIKCDHLVNNLLRCIPPSLRFLDFLGISSLLDEKVDDIETHLVSRMSGSRDLVEELFVDVDLVPNKKSHFKIRLTSALVGYMGGT